MFFPTLVWVQHDIEPITRVPRMHLSFIDVEREDVVHHLPAFKHWTFVFVLIPSSKKLIFVLNSPGIIFMIPLANSASRVSNSIGCLSNTKPEWSNFPMHATTPIYDNRSLIDRGWVDPDITSRRACGQDSRILALVTERVSERAPKVDEFATMGRRLQLFLSA